MTIQPLLTCALGIALVVVFETTYSYVEKRWVIPDTKDGWAGLFWFLILVVLVPSGIMPYLLPRVLHWAPFIAICFIHIMFAAEGLRFHSRRPPPSRGVSACPSTPPMKTSRIDIQDASKAKSTNKQKHAELIQ